MKISTIIDSIEQWLITFLLASMTLITFSQVIARYLFNSGAVWALEATTYLFAWLVLIGASYMIKCGAHIAVDSVANLFSVKIRKFITLFAILCCAVFVVIMLISSYDYITFLKEIEIEMEDLPVLEWQAKIVLPLAFGLMLYRLIEVFIRALNNQINTMHFENQANKSQP
jgi:C4-dicarboxylate transporter DctQ subunit